MAIERIVSARRLREAAWLLAAAFPDDPALHYVFHREFARRYVLPRMFKWLVSAACRDGRVMTLRSHDQLDGVAVWFPSPKAFPPPWHRALLPALAILPAYALEPAAEARNRWLEKFTRQLLGCVDVECVYLAALAVREDRRSSGVGTALVREGAAWAAGEDKRVHLHCWSPLVAYYEQLGFREICQGTFEGIADTCHGLLSSPDAASESVG